MIGCIDLNTIREIVTLSEVRRVPLNAGVLGLQLLATQQQECGRIKGMPNPPACGKPTPLSLYPPRLYLNGNPPKSIKFEALMFPQTPSEPQLKGGD